MGIPLTSLTDRQKRMIAPEVRAELGFAFATSAEAKAKYDADTERAAHKLFEQWLRLNQLPFVHCRMDRPTTVAKGWPDFTVLANGRGCCIEFKAEGGIVSEDQANQLAELAYRQVPVLVTTEPSDAIAFVKKELEL